jgi:uncharacterized protein (TIGR00255 family)
MIQSMTGYGRGEAHTGVGACVVEIRSLNHRYFEIAVKTPRGFAAVENRIREIVRSRFSRGRFDVYVGVDFGGVSTRRVVMDHALARQLHRSLADLGRELGLRPLQDVASLLELREIVRVEEHERDVEDSWPAIQEALESSLASLQQMRITEGEALAQDTVQRIHLIERGLEQLKSRIPATLVEYKQKLEERIGRLLGNLEIDPTRLAQEVVFYAERSDVTEETTRLNTHLIEFKKLLTATEPVGRKLDFLLQEMNREINTTSSKTADAAIAMLVVDIKSELEKIREQAQNIE